MATNYFSSLKGPDWINLANLGTSVVGGLAQGKASERAAGESAQEFALRQQQELYRQASDAYARRMSARSGIGAALQDQMLTRANAKQSVLNASPLGAEQGLAMSMARARGLSTAAENFTPLMATDPNIAGRVRPTSNILGAFTNADYRQTISPEATARSIAERRKAIGGVDPDFQFGAMSDYGLPDLAPEVQDYQAMTGADRQGRENQLMMLLRQQMEEASKPVYNEQISQIPQAAAQSEPEKKGTPWWKKVLKVASIAAPIVAAPFTGGASLALIGAGAGAANAALSGAGVGGTLMGAGLGGLTAGVGGGAAGSAANRVAGESARSAITRAVLNPRALASMGGAAIGGGAGGALQAGSTLLPGARPGTLPAGWEGPNMPNIGPGYTLDPGAPPPLVGRPQPFSQYPVAPSTTAAAAPFSPSVTPRAVSNAPQFPTGAPPVSAPPASGASRSYTQPAPQGMSPMAPVTSSPRSPISAAVMPQGQSRPLPPPAAGRGTGYRASMPPAAPQLPAGMTMSDLQMFLQNVQSRNGNIQLPSGPTGGVSGSWPVPPQPPAAGRGGQYNPQQLAQLIAALQAQLAQNVGPGLQNAGREFYRSSPFSGSAQ